MTLEEAELIDKDERFTALKAKTEKQDKYNLFIISDKQHKIPEMHFQTEYDMMYIYELIKSNEIQFYDTPHTIKNKETLKTAINGLNQIDARNPNSNEKEKIKTMDSNTADIPYILNKIIENINTINFIRTRFNRTQTPTILKTLNQHSKILTQNNICWNIDNYMSNEIELTFEKP